MTMDMAMNAVSIKESNINLVRTILCEGKELSKAQLAAESGLTVVTVGTILQGLLRSGEVFESSEVSSSGGRPAHLYFCNPDYKLSIVVYTFETERIDTVHYLVVNLLGEVLFRMEEKYDFGTIHLNSFVPRLSSLIQQFPAIALISFGLPGVEMDGRLQCDYAGLNQEYFTEYYRREFHLPVIFENDVIDLPIKHCRNSSKIV